MNLNLERYKVVHSADYKVSATYSDDFVLYRQEKFIEIILDEVFLDKKVKILLDNDTIFNGILKDASIFIYAGESLIDLDMLAKNILIVV